jgi:hypothetical protein
VWHAHQQQATAAKHWPWAEDERSLGSVLVVVRIRELRLSKPERQAAKAERRVEAQIRLERDNPYTAERRAAAREAERRRYDWLNAR